MADRYVYLYFTRTYISGTSFWESYLCLSATSLICFPPFGIFSFVYSYRSYNQFSNGKFADGKSNARRAQSLNYASFFAGLMFLTVCF